MRTEVAPLATSTSDLLAFVVGVLIGASLRLHEILKLLEGAHHE